MSKSCQLVGPRYLPSHKGVMLPWPFCPRSSRGRNISACPLQPLAQLSAHSRQALRFPERAHELLAKGPGAEESLTPYKKTLLLSKARTSKSSSWRQASCLPRWERQDYRDRRRFTKDVTQLMRPCAVCSAATAGVRLLVSPPGAWMTLPLLASEMNDLRTLQRGLWLREPVNG